jgi:hypothetical protein
MMRELPEQVIRGIAGEKRKAMGVNHRNRKEKPEEIEAVCGVIDLHCAEADQLFT